MIVGQLFNKYIKCGSLIDYATILFFFFNCITAPYFWNLSILFHVQYLALKCFCIVSSPDSSSSFLMLTLCNQKQGGNLEMRLVNITPLLTLQLIDFSLYLFTSCVCLFFLINCKIKLFLCSKKQNNTYPFQIKRLQRESSKKRYYIVGFSISSVLHFHTKFIASCSTFGRWSRSMSGETITRSNFARETHRASS